MSNPPYGGEPSPLPTDEFVVGQRNRQDVLFARICRADTDNGKGKIVDKAKWSRVAWSRVAKKPKKVAAQSKVEKAKLSPAKLRTQLRGLN